MLLCPVPGHSSSSDWWSVRSPYRPVRSSPSITGVPPGCGSQLLRHQKTACLYIVYKCIKYNILDSVSVLRCLISEVTNLAPQLLDSAARVVQGELRQVEPLYVAAESWAKKVGAFVCVSQYSMESVMSWFLFHSIVCYKRWTVLRIRQNYQHHMILSTVMDLP